MKFIMSVVTGLCPDPTKEVATDTIKQFMQKDRKSKGQNKPNRLSILFSMELNEMI